jgi:sugar phosphate isomerase/epimerase
LALSLSSVAEKEAPSFAPAFYPFLNGVKLESVAKGAQTLKELGYSGIGSVYGNVLEDYQREYQKAGLRIYSIYVGGKIGGSGAVYEPAVTDAIRRLKGTDTMVELFVQGGKNATDEQAVSFVQEIAGHARKSGLRVVLYPHVSFYIDTVGDALRIARASGMDNVGVAFNLCHFLKVEPGSDLRKTLDGAKPLLWSVSVCGADTDGLDWSTLIRPLDEGSFDQAALLRHLREIGYEGDVGMQCYSIKTAARENLRRSLAAWKINLAKSRLDKSPRSTKP